MRQHALPLAAFAVATLALAIAACAAQPLPAPAAVKAEMMARPICEDGRIVGMLVATSTGMAARLTWEEDPCGGGI